MYLVCTMSGVYCVWFALCVVCTGLLLNVSGIHCVRCVLCLVYTVSGECCVWYTLCLVGDVSSIHLVWYVFIMRLYFKMAAHENPQDGSGEPVKT